MPAKLLNFTKKKTRKIIIKKSFKYWQFFKQIKIRNRGSNKESN